VNIFLRGLIRASEARPPYQNRRREERQGIFAMLWCD
jgi:hypothetical protein